VVLFNFAQETEDKVETISFLGVWHRWRESQVPLNVSLPPSSANFPPPLPMTFWTLGDVSQDDRIPVEHRQSLIENEVRAVVNIPLRTGRRVIGFVDVQRATAGPFSPMAIRLYEALTDQAAVALERARLLAAARRRAEREATLRTLSDRVARAMDVQSVLHGAAEGLRRSLQAEGVYIGFGPGLEGEDG
jgi:GAF domain-containing protein